MTTIAFGPDLFGAKEDPTAQPTPPATIAAEAPASAFGTQIGIAAPTDTARIGELISVTITVSNTGAVAVSNLRYQLVGAWMPHLESVTDPVMRHEVEVPPGGFDRQAFELRAAQEGNATLQGYVMLDVPTDSGSRQGLLSEETVAIVVTPP